MKKFALIFAFALTLPALAVVTSAEAYRQDRSTQVLRDVLVGSELANAAGGSGLKATWDQAKTPFTSNGSYALYWNNEVVKLPSGAIVKNCFFDVVTTPTGTGGATVAFKVQNTADLKAATAVASWTGKIAGVPDGTVSTMIKLTAERTLYATVSGTAVSSGKINLFCEYALSN